MATITSFAPFADVGTLGVGAPRGANGHLIAIADDGSIVGLVSSSSTGPNPPRAYRTTNNWTSLTVTQTFTVETGSGAAFLSALINSGSVLLAGIWDDAATPDQAETWRSTDDGQTWSLGEVLNAGANYFRPYCYILMSNGKLFSGIGQANPNWWIDATGAGTASVDQGNWAGEGANRMIMDAVEVGTSGRLIVATIDRLNTLGLKTFRIYTSDTYGTGTTAITLSNAAANGAWRVRLYSVPGGTTVLASIYTGTLGVNSIWRSANSGDTWTQITSGFGTPDAFGTFFLASTGQIVVGSTLNGFYLSTDDGVTWSFISITGSPAATNIYSFVEAPITGGTRLFAAGSTGSGGSANPYIWASNDLLSELLIEPDLIPNDERIFTPAIGPFNNESECAIFDPLLTADWEFGSREVPIYLNQLVFENGSGQALSFTNFADAVLEFSATGQILSKANVEGVFGHYLGWTLQSRPDTDGCSPFRIETVEMEYAPTRQWDTSP